MSAPSGSGRRSLLFGPPLSPVRPPAPRAPHARLRAPRHDDLVRRAGHEDGQDHRQALPPPPRRGIREDPAIDRRAGPVEPGRASDPGQLRHAQDAAGTTRAGARHPRFHVRYSPTDASRINPVESWLAVLTNRRLCRGSFTPMRQLEAAVTAYLDANNNSPTPFQWTKSADDILDSVCMLLTQTTRPRSSQAAASPMRSGRRCRHRREGHR